MSYRSESGPVNMLAKKISEV